MTAAISRLEIVNAIRSYKTINEAAASLGVHRDTFRKYRDMYEDEDDLAQEQAPERSGKRIVVIPDLQIRPDVDYSFVEWIGKYTAEQRPDYIVQIGDWADFPSLSSYDKGKKSFEGRRLKADIDAANESIAMLTAPIEAEIKALRAKGISWKPEKHVTLGNHCERLNRLSSNAAEFDGLVTLDDLQFAKYGWQTHPFLEVLILEGVAFSHYFPSGVMGRPCPNAKVQLARAGMSIVTGHQQVRDVARSKRADGAELVSIIAGCGYPENAADEYLTPIARKCWRGVIVLNEVKYGAFDEMFVSLNYLEKKYK
jgi:hypothetical protein